MHFCIALKHPHLVYFTCNYINIINACKMFNFCIMDTKINVYQEDKKYPNSTVKL